MSEPPLTMVPEGVRVGDAVVRLTRVERALLAWLVAHPGEPQPAERLLREVWGWQGASASRTVVSTVHRLRAKLEAAGAEGRIRTVPGEGYLLERSDPGAELVGREAELATFRGWLGGAGRTLLVTGAPGVGKSALAAAALGASACRVDLASATLGGALEALDAAPAGALVWLDDADPVLSELAPVSSGRRWVVTCRYAVDLPGATRLHLDPLGPKAARDLLDRLLARRFPQASPSAAERSRRVEASGGNPARLRRVLWAAEGAGSPPGLDRHRTEAETLAWGLDGLPTDAERALRRLCAVPCALDDESAGVLVGYPQIRPVLAVLRDRGLLDEDDGCWSVPSALRERVDPDPGGAEALRCKVVADVPAVVTDPARLAPRARAAWGLLTWAVATAEDPDDLCTLLQGLDHHAVWGGPQFDSRPFLASAAERLPEREQGWLARRRARAEVRHGADPEDPRIQDLLKTAVALAEHPQDAMLARRSWIDVLIASGEYARAIESARELAEIARAARDASYESSAVLFQAVAHLRAGRFEEASEAARLARALDPDPQPPWHYAASFGLVLADTGRTAEALSLLRRAADDLRRAGRPVYATRFEAEAWWTAWILGETDLDTARSEIERAHATLDPRTAEPTALALAVIELTAGRIEAAAGHLRRAPTRRERAAEVRAVGAAIHASLRIEVRWDELPTPSAEADPRLARLADGFAHAALGRSAEALDALDAVSDHPARLVRALRPLLAQRIGARPPR